MIELIPSTDPRCVPSPHRTLHALSIDSTGICPSCGDELQATNLEVVNQMGARVFVCTTCDKHYYGWCHLKGLQ